MKFTVSTKPLSSGLDLGVINSNVSKFYRKSCLAQITATKDMLKINLEAASIVSEIKLKGFAEDGESACVFVDCVLLKQLVSTFESSNVVFEFVDGGVILHSGSSKFTLPQLVDSDELSLSSPSLLDMFAEGSEVSKDKWKFIKDRQMYSIAMSFIHPVYTKVWNSENNDVVVGDFDNSIFTHSNKGQLGVTCLLTDTIINLLNALPEGAKIFKNDKKYVIKIDTDSYSYVSEFSPSYEDDPDVGSYNSEMILSMMVHSEDFIKLKSAAISKVLNQASLISSSSEDTMTVSFQDGVFCMKDNNVECKVTIPETACPAFSIPFKTTLLQSMLAHYTEEDICVAPLIQEDEAIGIIVWSEDLTSILAGVDD